PRGRDICRERSGLINVARSFPPDPLAGALNVLPNVIQIACALDSRGTIAPARNQPDIVQGVGKAYRAPARAGKIASCGNLLRSVDTCLIGKPGSAAARNPCPLAGASVVFPEIVQQRAVGSRRAVTQTVEGPRISCTRGIEPEAAEEPHVLRHRIVDPQHGLLAPARDVRSCCCSLSAVNTIVLAHVRVGPAYPGPLPSAYIVFPEVVQ